MHQPTKSTTLVKILKTFYENRFFAVAERHFFVFRELYLREDKSKDPEIFRIDGSKLGLLSMKISFILVKPQGSYFQNTDPEMEFHFFERPQQSLFQE